MVALLFNERNDVEKTFRLASKDERLITLTLFHWFKHERTEELG